MRDEQLYESIRERADLESTDAAREAAAATLRTLGERIANGEATDLAEHLPAELADAVVEPGDEADASGPDEFVSRVVERLDDVDPAAAERLVQATFEAVGSRTNLREWRDVRTQLPGEFGRLYEVGPA